MSVVLELRAIWQVTHLDLDLESPADGLLERIGEGFEVVGLEPLLDKTAGRSERHGALTLLDEANGPDGEVKGLRTDAGLKERERLGPGGGKGSGVHRSSEGEERTQRDEMIAKSGFFGQKNPRDSTGMAEQSPGAGEHTTSTK